MNHRTLPRHGHGPDAAAHAHAHDPFENRSDPFPWKDEDEPAPEHADAPPAAAGPRQRHDAFTDARKYALLEALMKTGCLLDACRIVGVSARTVYRHQESDPRFAENCSVALKMRAAPVELTAWQRAVEGVEQEFACGGQVHVRRRYSDGLLRMLLQGSNPKKFGARPGFKRKRLYRHEKKQMEREIRAEIAAEMPTFDESIEMLEKRLDALNIPLEPRDEDRTAALRLADGWTRTPDEHWIPPGYGPIPGWQPPAEGEIGTGTPRDSM
jgi:hypothetical protein